MLRRRDLRSLGTGRGQHQVEDRAGPASELGRAMGRPCLDALEEQPVEQRGQPAGDRVDIDPRGQLTPSDAFL